VGQCDEDAEDDGVRRTAARSDDVGSRDGLAVARGGRVNGAEPEASGEVEKGLGHGKRSHLIRHTDHSRNSPLRQDLPPDRSRVRGRRVRGCRGTRVVGTAVTRIGRSCDARHPCL
jgi:hypothetical protein